MGYLGSSSGYSCRRVRIVILVRSRRGMQLRTYVFLLRCLTVCVMTFFNTTTQKSIGESIPRQVGVKSRRRRVLRA
jgi:hypothetical protein